MARCPVTDYAKKVESGKIVACKWVRLACRRHLSDLAEGKRRGIVWDAAAADKAFRFFDFLRHSKGKWGGEQFQLEPWQKFLVGSLFGWKRKKDGTRRFRIGYVEVARKNGKSTIAAGIGLYLLLADGEPGSEVYSAATKRDQAKLTHGEATRMVRQSKPLLRYVMPYKDNLSVPKTNSKYEPLGADADSLDGLNPHGIICDELHAWKSRDLWDVLDTARGARAQPITLAITTAGVNEDSICGEQRSYTTQVLEGMIVDDSHFGLIYTIDDGDDWKNSDIWIKANPNLGVSVSKEYLSEVLQKASVSSSASNAFKRLYLNIWTKTVDGWLNMDDWNVCGAEDYCFDERGEEMASRECYGGLDIASTNDIAAFVLVFPFSIGSSNKKFYRVVPRFWVPSEGHTRREKKLREILHPWIAKGFVRETEGDVIDIATIEEEILQLKEVYNIKEIAYDPWNAESTAQRLAASGIEMFKFPQNMSTFNEPSKELESLVINHGWHHNNNPVLKWMASNVAIKEDGRGYIMPSRKNSPQKIDGIPAAIMALARAMLVREDTTPSIDIWDYD